MGILNLFIKTYSCIQTRNIHYNMNLQYKYIILSNKIYLLLYPFKQTKISRNCVIYRYKYIQFGSLHWHF